MKIREDSEKGIFLENCLWTNVKNENECKEVFQRGSKNRAIELNEDNEYSTRSHTILIISVEKYYLNDKIKQNKITKGLLYLVDLAGTERIGMSYVKGKKLEHAKKINNSLSVLGSCIDCIVTGKTYIPFRESKLTRILKEVLRGNSNTCLIVTLSPSDLDIEETFNSLNFASRAMKVLINPKKNMDYTEENSYEEANQRYTELLEKYNELNLKYKNKENFEKEKYIKIINEYKDKIKEINIILNEKENEINYLNNELKQIKQINKEKRFDYFKNNYIDKNVLEVETKELLKKQGIEIEEINKNNINQIIKQLLINNEQKTYDNIELKSKIVILNSSIKQIKKDNEEKYNIMEKEKKNSLINYYSEKIDFLEKENNKLRNINNKNFEKSNKISEERNKIKRNLTELKKVKLEKDELSNQIYSLKENNKKLNEINSQLIMKNKDIESKYETEVKKYEESKLSKLSNHSMKIENIRLKSSINFNERLLNNEINLMINDLELFNKLINFKKNLKNLRKLLKMIYNF